MDFEYHWMVLLIAWAAAATWVLWNIDRHVRRHIKRVEAELDKPGLGHSFERYYPATCPRCLRVMADKIVSDAGKPPP